MRLVISPLANTSAPYPPLPSNSHLCFITEQYIPDFICIDHRLYHQVFFTFVILWALIWSSLFDKHTHTHTNEVRGLSQLIIFPVQEMDDVGESQLVVKGWRRRSSKRFSKHHWTELGWLEETHAAAQENIYGLRQTPYQWQNQDWKNHRITLRACFCARYEFIFLWIQYLNNNKKWS